MRQWPKLGIETMARLPMRARCSSTCARVARRLERLAQHHVIEGAGGIIRQIVVGVALDHAEAVAHAGVHARLRQLHAAPVHVLLAGEIGQQFAVAAADVEHARARIDHLGGQSEIAAQLGRRREVARVHAHPACNPRCWAQPSRKPRSVAWNSGSSKRKASWPLSVSTSTKLTLAAAAFSACTISRLSGVG